MNPVLVGFAAASSGVALWLLSRGSMGASASPAPAAVPTRITSGPSHLARVAQTVLTESGGRVGAVNRNTDGAGLSYGLIQWSQGGGGLAPFLEAMRRDAPWLWTRHFGPDGDQMLAAVKSSRMSVRLWESPWVDRFVAAGRDPDMETFQLEQIERGPYMQAAVKAAQRAGDQSDRFFALAFDIAVQMGPERMLSFVDPGTTAEALGAKAVAALGSARTRNGIALAPLRLKRNMRILARVG